MAGQPHHLRVPMKGSVLIDVGPATGQHGERGIGRYVRSLMECIGAMPDADRSGIWAYGLPGPGLEGFGQRGIPIEQSRFAVAGWLSGRLAAGRALRLSHASVLHATDPHRPWSPRSHATIVTAYDLIPLHEPEMLHSWRPDHRAVYRWYLQQLRRAHRVVAISMTTAEDVAERLGIQPGQIDVVYPAVQASLDFIRDPSDSPTFLFVGARDPHKQADLALRAFALFRTKLGIGAMRFIGPASGAQIGALRQLADHLGVGSWVQIDGRVSDAELDRAYARASALLWTSRLEGFGLPPIEAVLRGVPVIAVDTPAARETLGRAASLVPSDAETLAAAMEAPLAATPSTVAALREKYSSAAGTRALSACYERASG